MGRAKPMVLGRLSFTKQTDAKSYFSELLGRTRVGSIVAKNDADDLLLLLRLHRDVEEKIGCGVDFFTAMISDEGSKCFAVVRKDNTMTDFSFHRCIDQRW
jgi:hypothetical protein